MSCLIFNIFGQIFEKRRDVITTRSHWQICQWLLQKDIQPLYVKGCYSNSGIIKINRKGSIRMPHWHNRQLHSRNSHPFRRSQGPQHWTRCSLTRVSVGKAGTIGWLSSLAAFRHCSWHTALHSILLFLGQHCESPKLKTGLIVGGDNSIQPTTHASIVVINDISLVSQSQQVSAHFPLYVHTGRAKQWYATCWSGDPSAPSTVWINFTDRVGIRINIIVDIHIGIIKTAGFWSQVVFDIRSVTHCDGVRTQISAGWRIIIPEPLCVRIVVGVPRR